MKALNVIKAAIKDNQVKVKNAKRMKKRDIKRVGIVVTKHFNHKKKIKDMVFMLKEKFGDKVEVVTSGDNISYEKYVKSYALQFDCLYKEFIPAHMQRTLYSAMGASFYGKDYSPKNFFVRDNSMGKYIDLSLIHI